MKKIKKLMAIFISTLLALPVIAQNVKSGIQTSSGIVSSTSGIVAPTNSVSLQSVISSLEGVSSSFSGSTNSINAPTNSVQGLSSKTANSINAPTNSIQSLSSSQKKESKKKLDVIIDKLKKMSENEKELDEASYKEVILSLKALTYDITTNPLTEKIKAMQSSDAGASSVNNVSNSNISTNTSGIHTSVQGVSSNNHKHNGEQINSIQSLSSDGEGKTSSIVAPASSIVSTLHGAVNSLKIMSGSAINSSLHGN